MSGPVGVLSGGSVKERGIPFSSELVPRVIDGTKTQTRRIILKFNGSPDENGDFEMYSYEAIVAMTFREGRWWFETEYGKQYPYRYVVPIVGDRLWIREAWWCDDLAKAQDIMDHGTGVYRKATEIHPEIFPRWKSGRFMPKWAARPQRLEIVRVGAERIQDISEEDAKAEGVMTPANACYSARHNFMILWDKLNAKRGYGWKANPWVWVREWPPVTS